MFDECLILSSGTRIWQYSHLSDNHIALPTMFIFPLSKINFSFPLPPLPVQTSLLPDD